MAPLRQAIPQEGATDSEMVKKRRRGKRHAAEDQSWESVPRHRHDRGDEKKQMNLLLIGGGLLLAVTLGGVAILMKSQKPAAEVPPSETVSPVVEIPVAEPVVAAPEKTDAQLLAEAEPVVRKFMEASTVAELVPLVRHPEVTEARMKGFYADGSVAAPGLANFDATNGLARLGKVMSLQVLTSKFESREMAFFDTPDGIKIDWESWVGWSEMPWEKFRSDKPEKPHVFRVILAPVAYYNFGFQDDSKWTSYRLVSPDGDQSIYGYVVNGSAIADQLLPDPDVKKVSMTLSLKFPAGATSDNQVEIVEVIADGWVEGMDSP
jgi:hypothetical protein